MNKIGNNIVAEIKRYQVKKINVHGIIGKHGPGDVIKSAMFKPKLRYGQMMDQHIPDNGRGKTQNNFCKDKDCDD
jgi:hypothetical protein